MPVQSLEKYPWYHGRIMRNKAEYYLNNGVDGSFLVRESESTPGDFSISLRCNGKVGPGSVSPRAKLLCAPGGAMRRPGRGWLTLSPACNATAQVLHYRINKSAAGLYVQKDSVFPTLPLLVAHLGEQSGGLDCCLKYPVPQGDAVIYGVSRELDDRWELDRATIVLGPRLGAGQYGEVYEGTLRNYERKVAVKTFKEETTNAADFLEEANFMKKVRRLCGGVWRRGPAR